jgi:uncharacterized membrane protein YccC
LELRHPYLAGYNPGPVREFLATTGSADDSRAYDCCLAKPTRGQALDKAAFRLLATVVGVTASIAITGMFSQARDLILAAFAVWIGICVFAAKLLDGYRAYAAVLSGYTVGLIAVQQIDHPQHVFESGLARGAAIVVGILSIAVVNTLIFASDRQPGMLNQLTAVHRRVREYASAAFRREPGSSAAFLTLLREIVALRPAIASVALESSSGSVRSATAPSAAVALVAELQAARLKGDPESEASAWAAGEVPRRDAEVRRDLAALRSARWPLQVWRAPLHRSWRTAAESGVRATVWIAIASAFYVWAGWPAASVSLPLVALATGLGSTTPNPRGFTAIALVGTPVAAVLAGTLEFVVLNGADSFLVLVLGLAPLTIGAALLLTSKNFLWSGLGRLILTFTMVMLSPSNPQTLQSAELPHHHAIFGRGNGAPACGTDGDSARLGGKTQEAAARRRAQRVAETRPPESRSAGGSHVPGRLANRAVSRRGRARRTVARLRRCSPASTN